MSKRLFPYQRFFPHDYVPTEKPWYIFKYEHTVINRYTHTHICIRICTHRCKYMQIKHYSPFLWKDGKVSTKSRL